MLVELIPKVFIPFHSQPVEVTLSVVITRQLQKSEQLFLWGMLKEVGIPAAAASPSVSTVVSLSPQTFGAEAVYAFRDFQSLLLMHGTEDDMFPIQTAHTIYEFAHDPKELLLFKGANHDLDEAAPEVFTTIRDWILSNMKV
jgi:pimeloyl-ACP methyl ester carboxylesterase